VALVFGLLAHRLKLSPIVGYLLAGVAVGPFTPGFVADRHVAEQFAQIGVILLLFGIGLRFDLHELVAVWRVAVPGALIQSAMSTLSLALLLRLLGLLCGLLLRSFGLNALLGFLLCLLTGLLGGGLCLRGLLSSGLLLGFYCLALRFRSLPLRGFELRLLLCLL